MVAKNKNVKNSTGKRYTEEQKSKILAFVEEQGRGGISAAGKKFGVSYIALRRWMNKKSGLPTEAKNVKPGRPAKMIAPVSAKGLKGMIAALENGLDEIQNSSVAELSNNLAKARAGILELKEFFAV